MKNQDEKFAKLYKELYSGASASAELKGKVRTMTNSTSKKAKISKRVIAALVAAAVVIVGGTIATSATRKNYVGKYTTVYFNGEPVQARYGGWDKSQTYIIEAEKDGKTYAAYIWGEYDKSSMPLYFTTLDDCVVASTDPQQELNLYKDIDKAAHAEIKNDTLYYNRNYLYSETEDHPHISIIPLGSDANDGKKDGVFVYENTKEVESFIITPEGILINTLETPGVLEDDDYSNALWGYLWGEETAETIEEYENAYRDSDGNLFIN